MRTTALPLPLLILGLAACADAGGELADEAVRQATASGQTLVFVGQDPGTLESDIYLVRAQSFSDLAGAEAPDLREAEGYDLEPLGALESAPINGSVVQSDSAVVFPAEAPFALPDQDGSHVAVTALSYDEAGEPAGGRVAVVRVTPRERWVSPLLEGLRGARFTWRGDHLVLLLGEATGGAGALAAVRVDELSDLDAIRPIGPPPSANPVRWAAPVRGGDSLLALQDELDSGRTDVLLIDASDGSWRDLTEHTGLSAGHPRLSPDGRLLAVTLRDLSGTRRDIAVLSIDEPEAPAHVLLDDPDLDCWNPEWSPALDAGTQRLAFFCLDVANNRPDVHVWSTEGSAEAGDGETLTGGFQPEVPGQLMEDLVLRSGPHWDPSGRIVVFGASRERDALEGAGMTLLARSLDDPAAYSIYPASRGAIDWVHFSAASDEPSALVWNRDASGLNDSGGEFPIEVVSAEPGSTPRAVRLETDLYVSYPVFLGQNTLFYP